jgi:SAM-dependent methyltransferase
MRRSKFLRAVLVGGLVAVIALFAWRAFGPAEDEGLRPANGFNPGDFVKARPRLDAPYVVSDNDVVDAMLALAEVRPDEKVTDLGSGDGRILIAAARSHGARGLGVDIDPARVREATANAAAAGVAHRVTFRREDLFRTPLGDTDVLTLYLSQDINVRLRDRILTSMRPGTRVVSHDFDMGEWRPDQRQQIGTANVYLWIVPARVSGRWAMSVNGQNATLTIDQHYQQFTGALELAGQTARIEQGRVTADRIRFILRLGGLRRVYEGRLQGNQLVGPNWRAVRAAS